MTQHIELDHEDIVHQGFFDPIQELLGASAPNFRIVIKNSTTIEIDAGTGNAQISIAIQGRYRWRTTDITAALPGGLADGTHPIFVTASDNDFSGPVNDPDKDTVYTFGLAIHKNGDTPSSALYRQVGWVEVKAGAIAGLRQTVASVSGAQIEDGALSNAGSGIWTREPGGGLLFTLKENIVSAREVADNAVDSAALIDLCVITAKVAALAITEGKLAENSVSTAKIVALAVTAAKLAAGSVTTEKLAPLAATTEIINNLAITTAKLAVESVTGEKVGPLAISEAKLAAEAVGTAKIKNLAVTAAKLGEEAVSAIKIAGLAVTTAKIAELAVTESKIADGAVSSRKWKPTSGLMHSTAEVDISGGTFLNLPGAIVSITPSVASRLYIVTAFAFQCTGVGANVSGTISVDGVIDTQHCCGFGWGAQTAQHSISGLTETYEVKLSAAFHTIRLVASGNAGSGFTETAAHKNCTALWWLAAE